MCTCVSYRLAGERRPESAVDDGLDGQRVELRVEGDGKLPCHHRRGGGWHTALSLRGAVRLGYLARGRRSEYVQVNIYPISPALSSWFYLSRRALTLLRQGLRAVHAPEPRPVRRRGPYGRHADHAVVHLERLAPDVALHARCAQCMFFTASALIGLTWGSLRMRRACAADSTGGDAAGNLPILAVSFSNTL